MRDVSATHGDDPTIPTLVAVPGTMCAPAVFDLLRARLRGQVEVVAVSSMPGDGPWTVRAVATRISRDIQQLGRGPVLLAGHSTGGAIAMCVALEHPGLVSGLVLIDTGPHMKGHGDVDAIIDRVADDWGPELREAVLRRSFATPVTPAFHDQLVDYAAGVPQRAVLEVLRSQRELDLTAHLHRLTMPAVVVHGDRDPTRPVDVARELAAALPSAELRVVPAGHSPMYEIPDSVADAVLTVAARAVGSGPSTV